MDEEIIIYTYTRLPFIVTTIFDPDKFRFYIKVFKEGELAGPPLEYGHGFWSKVRTKKEISSSLRDMGVWKKEEAGIEIEKMCLMIYERFEEQKLLKTTTKKEERPPLNPLEEERAKTILKSGKLMKYLRMDMDKVIAGETTNKLLLFFIYCSANMENKIHPRMMGGSSAGKTYLLNNVADYMPEEMILMRATRATGKSLEYHLENQELDGKIMIIQEFEGAQDTVISLRPLMSGDNSEGGLNLMTVGKDAMGNQVKRTIKSKGVPIVAMASTKINLDEEFETRTWKMEADESVAQSKKIMSFEAENEINPDMHKTVIQKDVRNMIRILKDQGLKKVKVMFAHKIADSFPHDNLRIRRDLKKIFMFVKVSAWLHQLQRPIVIFNGEPYIMATLDDWIIANELYGPSLELTFSGRSKKMKKVFSKIKDYGASATVEELIKITGVKKQNLSKYLKELESLGMVYVETDLKDRRKKKYYVGEEDSNIVINPSKFGDNPDSPFFTLEEFKSALAKIVISSSKFMTPPAGNFMVIPADKDHPLPLCLPEELLEHDLTDEELAIKIDSYTIKREIDNTNIYIKEDSKGISVYEKINIKELHRGVVTSYYDITILTEEETMVDLQKMDEISSDPKSITSYNYITISGTLWKDAYKEVKDAAVSLAPFDWPKLFGSLTFSDEKLEKDKEQNLSHMLKKMAFEGIVFCPFKEGEYHVIE